MEKFAEPLAASQKRGCPAKDIQRTAHPISWGPGNSKLATLHSCRGGCSACACARVPDNEHGKRGQDQAEDGTSAEDEARSAPDPCAGVVGIVDLKLTQEQSSLESRSCRSWSRRRRQKQPFGERRRAPTLRSGFRAGLWGGGPP